MLQIKTLLKWMGFFPSIFFLCCAFQHSYQIDQGVRYSFRKEYFPPRVIHVLEVDPKSHHMIIARAYDECIGRESLETLCLRKGAVAAINGGFFGANPLLDGNPAGLLKIEGDWYSLGQKTRGALGWTKDGHKVMLDHLCVKCLVESNNRKIPVQGINRVRKKGETIAYTSTFHRTTLSPQQTLEVIIDQQKVQEISRKGSSRIPEQGFILALDPDSPNLASLEPFQNLFKLNYEIQSFTTRPEDWEKVDYVIGGAPALILKGKIVTDFAMEQICQTFLKTWNARTAVGIKEDGHWVFVVVEGKKPFRSLGMTIAELANFMSQLGCVEALNLDGGSSSTLVIKGRRQNEVAFEGKTFKITNTSPKVSDAILILNRDCEQIRCPSP